ncbi:MAG: site-specific integrase, partial [Thermaerobacter sp.]|nr:site-specific integrase [Thermaerobacter sp.]
MARRARGSIRPQGEHTWRVEVRRGRDPVTGKLLRTSVTVEGSRRDAERELTRILRELDTGAFVDPARETFGEFLERWLRDYAAHNVRSKTLELYGILVRRHVAPALGSLPLPKVAPAKIQEFYSRKLEEGLSAQTVRHMHTVIRESLGHAVKWGLLARNPAEAVMPPRVRRRELTVWSLPEARRFLAAAESSPHYPVFLLAIFCGLRRGEVLGLKWSDIDWDAGLLMVRRQLALVGGRPTVQELKTAKSRRV